MANLSHCSNSIITSVAGFYRCLIRGRSYTQAKPLFGATTYLSRCREVGHIVIGIAILNT